MHAIPEMETSSYRPLKVPIKCQAISPYSVDWGFTITNECSLRAKALILVYYRLQVLECPLAFTNRIIQPFLGDPLSQ